jgi:hypothetical protein
MSDNKVSNSQTETLNLNMKCTNDINNSQKNIDSTNYIIQLNQQLLLGNRELIMENNSLKKITEHKDDELDDKENDIGRTEKSNIYLKSLLKNFLEMSKLYQEVSDNRKFISDNNYNFLKIFKKEIKEIRYILLCIYGLLLAISFMIIQSYIIFFILIIFSILPICVIEYYISVFQLPKYREQELNIKDIYKKIKELDSSQDYIHEFIDQI